jgi:hypothetical protein
VITGVVLYAKINALENSGNFGAGGSVRISFISFNSSGATVGTCRLLQVPTENKVMKHD